MMTRRILTFIVVNIARGLVGGSVFYGYRSFLWPSSVLTIKAAVHFFSRVSRELGIFFTILAAVSSHPVQTIPNYK